MLRIDPMSQQPVYYFDNNATTRVAPEVVAAMTPFLNEFWGNPSSSYSFGNQVARHIEEARAKVAALIHAGGVFDRGKTASTMLHRAAP